MFPRLTPVLLCPLAWTLGSALQDSRGQTIQLAPVDSSFLPANISNAKPTIALNASNEIQIRCDGEKYGVNPSVADCQKARTYYTRSKLLITYGERHSGHEANVFPLPYRLLGDQALCYFEPILIDASLGTGTTTMNDISAASYELILQCAVRHSKGGIATGIGGANVALILGAYQPNVQCGGSFPEWKSCRNVLGDMPALKHNEIFGPHTDPRVQFPVPMVIQSNDRQCIVRLLGTGRTDITSWYKIWEAVSAVYAVCTRRQRVGSFRGLGELGSIFFTMSSKPLQLGNESISSVSIDGALDED